MKNKIQNKTLLLIITFSLISAIFVASSVFPASAAASEYWRGYRVHQGKGEWVKSNLSPSVWYSEGDWVPYCLVVTDASKLWDELIAGNSFDIGWNFLSGPKDAIYIDMLGELRYKWDGDTATYSTNIPFDDGDPGYSGFPMLGFGGTAGSDAGGWVEFDADLFNRPGATHLVDGKYEEDLNETCADPRDDHFMRITPGVGGFPDAGDFASHDNIVIYFQAHLSLTMMWRYGQAYQMSLVLEDLAGTWYLGDDGLGGGNDWTCSWNGSSFFQGAASHFRLASNATGNVEIQIPIAQYPAGEIQGHKYVDVDADGCYNSSAGDYPYPDGWGINGTATIPIGATTITFPIGYKITNSTGGFEYSGLVSGIYEICEDDFPQSGEEGWIHTGTAIDGVCDPGPETCVAIEFASGTRRYIDFLNTYGWPELDIDKYCSGKVLVGGDINFTVVLTNTGTQDAEDVEVTDFLPAGVTYVGGATATSGDLDTTTLGKIVWNGTILKDGGTVTIIIPVVASSTGEQLNNATYTRYPDNAEMIHTSAVCSTPVYDPCISLEKTAEPGKILSGDEVTFYYNVTNCGDLPLTVDIEDDQFGTIVSAASLAVGEWKEFNHTAAIFADVTNVAVANGSHQLGNVLANASANVDVRYPCISLTKEANPSKILNGTEVTFTYNVTNCGDLDLTVDIVDDQFGSIASGESLLVGQSKEFNYTTPIYADVTNVAVANGSHQLGNVYANASASVDVIHPDIEIEKWVDPVKILAGDTVDYYWNITNTGDVNLTYSVYDDQFGWILVGMPLPVGEEDAWWLPGVTLYDDVTNVATVYGEHQLGEVSDNASASVDVRFPCISLVKTADPVKILSGDEVTFYYNVTNCGDLNLTGVTILDDQFGTIVSGASLAVGEWKEFNHTAAIFADVTNVANVTGTHQLGTVEANSSASVDVIHPDIEVTKSCTPASQLPLGDITWTILINNTGDVWLNVTSYDSLHGHLWDGALAPGGSHEIVITDYDLDSGTYTDTANATGYHQLGQVFDEDNATCSIAPLYLKTFTDASAIGGFTEPTICCSGLCSRVYELYSGPRIWWNITYYFENTEDYLGDDYDGEGHYFVLWDKWGGNLMALDSPPANYTTTGNANKPTFTLYLANGASFDINPRLTGTGSYRGYIGDGRAMNDSCGGEAWITPHSGDQQNGTNPGKGKGSNDNSQSYDMDVVWYIGWLEPGESCSFTMYIAPGQNPGGKLEFTSTGCYYINTGPRVRVYADADYTDFMYAIDRTNRLRVCVFPD